VDTADFQSGKHGSRWHRVSATAVGTVRGPGHVRAVAATAPEPGNRRGREFQISAAAKILRGPGVVCVAASMFANPPPQLRRSG